MAKKKSIAKSLGRGMAHFQALVDDVLDIGFKKMKSAGDKGIKKQKTDTVKGKILFSLKKTAGFFGDVGSEFYDKYEKIKAEKRKKK